MSQQVHNINEGYTHWARRTNLENSSNTRDFGFFGMVFGIMFICFGWLEAGITALILGAIFFLIGRYGTNKSRRKLEEYRNYPTSRVMQD